MPTLTAHRETIPLLLSGPLYARCANVEDLLHREGYLVGSPTPLTDLTSLRHLLSTLGFPWEEEGDPPPTLVLPVLKHLDVRTGGALSLPSSATFAAALSKIGTLILGGTYLPSFALSPRLDEHMDPSSQAMTEILAPVPPPSLPQCRTLQRATAAHTNSSKPRHTSTSFSSSSFSSSSHSSIPAGDTFVPLDEVLGFVFPSNEVHPRSTGRLIMYALHGPLHQGTLVGGRAGGRPLTPQELEAAIDAIEEEDVLGAYTGGSVLGGGAKEVLDQVRLDGAYSQPQLRQEQVVAMLGHIPLTPGLSPMHPPTLSFSAIQAAVLGARAQRVVDLGMAYPPEPTLAQAKERLAPPPPLLGRSRLLPQLTGTTVPLEAMAASRRGPQNAAQTWDKYSDIARTRKVNGLLHTRLQQVSHIWGTNTSTLIGPLLANTALIRDSRDEPGKEEWVTHAPFTHLKNVGTYVPATKHFASMLPRTKKL